MDKAFQRMIGKICIAYNYWVLELIFWVFLGSIFLHFSRNLRIPLRKNSSSFEAIHEWTHFLMSSKVALQNDAMEKKIFFNLELLPLEMVKPTFIELTFQALL